MIIRPAKPSDLDVVMTIMDRCDLRADDVDYTRWDGLILIAERQGEPIGFIHALAFKPYAVITHLAVLPEHQKGRAAVKLLESAELLLRSLGCQNWFTFVWEKHTAIADMLSRWGAIQSPDVGHVFKRIL